MPAWLRQPPRSFLLAWDAAIVLLALASVLLIAYYDRAPPQTRELILLADYGVVLVFLADFVWDVYRAPDRARYLRRNWWALLGMVPLAWTEMSWLRVLRLTRLLRVLRIFRTIAEFLVTAQRVVVGGHVAKLILTSGSIMLGGSLLVWLVERDVNPRLAEFPDALWWATVTVTTVGYGDVVPQTGLGRIIAGGLMVTGIGTIGLLAGQLGSQLAGMHDSGRRDVAATLERLAALHEGGKLTDAEFRAAKAKVLHDAAHKPRKSE